MPLIVVDVESDGPIPLKYSMVCFGAVVVTPELNQTFYGKTRPISKLWIPEALAISGISREKHKSFPDPLETMQKFKEWLDAIPGHKIFISDNNGYDFAWINWYFHWYLGGNPFGFSSRRIGDLYAGLTKDMYARWKHLRKTHHTHNPVDDAKGNAEALLEMQQMGLKFM